MQVETILKKLVQISSQSGKEEALAKFILLFCREHGLRAEMQGGNLVIRFIHGSSKAFIFNAHMDTVSPGDMDSWNYPPFGMNAGAVKKGKLYGLGSSDDKSGIAAFLKLALELKVHPLSIDIFFVFVVNEEVDGAGTKLFVSYFKKQHMHKYTAVAAVIGEPTDLKHVEIGHRGNAFIAITTYGDSGHGSEPQKIKKHAVNEMITVIHTMKSIERKAEKKFSHPVLGKPSFCLTGMYTTQSSPNKVPESCVTVWDIRTTPGLHNDLLPFLASALDKKVSIGFLEDPAPYSITSENEKILTIFKNIVPKIEVTIAKSANDMCFLNQAGIPTIVFGPGISKVMHQPNEYCSLENVRKAINIYRRLVEEYSKN